MSQSTKQQENDEAAMPADKDSAEPDDEVNDEINDDDAGHDFEVVSEAEVERAHAAQATTADLVRAATEAEDIEIQRVIEGIKEDPGHTLSGQEVEKIEEKAGQKDEESENQELSEQELAIIRLVELRGQLHEWTELREMTIAKLMEIADYVDTVSRRTGVARVLSSGTGIAAGILTLVGGALTLATAGAALPVLLAGTGLGLTAGLTGGAASIAEKIITSRQMKEAEEALKKDQELSKHLEESVSCLKQNSFVSRQIAKQALWSGAGAASNSAQLINLVSTGGAITQVGAETAAKIFGEDVGKEVSRILLHASGRILSGSVTVIMGGATMFYDVYRLNAELSELAKLGQEGASEIRTIAVQLDASLRELCGEEKEREIGKCF